MTTILILAAAVLVALGLLGAIATASEGGVIGFVFSDRMISTVIEALFGLLN